MAHYTIHFDGSCWPNPGGTAGYGYAIDYDGLPSNFIVKEEAGVVGTGPEMSNNGAEFYALYKAFAAMPPTFLGDTIRVRGDSQLVINIMLTKFKSNPEKLYYSSYALAEQEYMRLSETGARIEFQWIPRERNDRCDKLSKEYHKAKK